MNTFRFIIRQGRSFTLIVIVLPIIAGTYAYQSLPKEGEPEIAVPHAIVVTTYPGASPSEIESLVTNPLEEALSDLKDVDEMRSSSAESVSVIVIDFFVDADLELSLQRVREKVTDARKELPEEAEDPTVSEISFSDIPIMLVSVVGDMDPVLLKRLAEKVADELARQRVIIEALAAERKALDANKVADLRATLRKHEKDPYEQFERSKAIRSLGLETYVVDDADVPAEAAE